MKKMCLLIAFVLLGTMAFAAPVHFNFNIGCANFLATRYTPGTGIPKKFLTGIVDRSACPGINVVMGGFQHGNPLSIPPNVAPVDDFNLPFYGLYGLDYSLNYLVSEKTCGFASYLGNGNALYLINSGTCTRIAGPTPAVPTKQARPATPSKIPVLSGSNR